MCYVFQIIILCILYFVFVYGPFSKDFIQTYNLSLLEWTIISYITYKYSQPDNTALFSYLFHTFIYCRIRILIIVITNTFIYHLCICELISWCHYRNPSPFSNDRFPPQTQLSASRSQYQKKTGGCLSRHTRAGQTHSPW